jgi:hypothetical protein
MKNFVIIFVTLSKRIRLVGQIGEMHTKFWSYDLVGRHHLEDPGIDMRIMGPC